MSNEMHVKKTVGQNFREFRGIISNTINWNKHHKLDNRRQFYISHDRISGLSLGSNLHGTLSLKGS